jgi:hypothetical protein
MIQLEEAKKFHLSLYSQVYFLSLYKLIFQCAWLFINKYFLSQDGHDQFGSMEAGNFYQSVIIQGNLAY